MRRRVFLRGHTEVERAAVGARFIRVDVVRHPIRRVVANTGGHVEGVIHAYWITIPWGTGLAIHAATYWFAQNNADWRLQGGRRRSGHGRGLAAPLGRSKVVPIWVAPRSVSRR